MSLRTGPEKLPTTSARWAGEAPREKTVTAPEASLAKPTEFAIDPAASLKIRQGLVGNPAMPRETPPIKPSPAVAQSIEPAKSNIPPKCAKSPTAPTKRRVRKLVTSQPNSYALSASQLSNEAVPEIPISVLYAALPRRFKVIEREKTRRESGAKQRSVKPHSDQFVFGRQSPN